MACRGTNPKSKKEDVYTKYCFAIPTTGKLGLTLGRMIT